MADQQNQLKLENENLIKLKPSLDTSNTQLDKYRAEITKLK